MRKIMDDYLVSCELRGVKPNTCSTYKIYLKPFVDHVPKIEHQPDFLAYLNLHYPNKRSAFAVFRTVKSFVRWAAMQGFMENWIEGMKFHCPDAPQTPTLTEDEFTKILNAIPANTDLGRRDRAFYALLFYTGARRDAVRLLKVSDVDIKERWIKIKTKGDKEAFLPVAPKAIQLLHTWLIHRRKDTDWVFPSLRHKEKVVDDHHLSRRIHVYAEAAGFTRRIYVHLLRHSCATLMAMSDVSIDVVSAMLMHSNLKTTQIYLSKLTAQARMRAAVAKVFK